VFKRVLNEVVNLSTTESREARQFVYYDNIQLVGRNGSPKSLVFRTAVLSSA